MIKLLLTVLTELKISGSPKYLRNRKKDAPAKMASTKSKMPKRMHLHLEEEATAAAAEVAEAVKV